MVVRLNESPETRLIQNSAESKCPSYARHRLVSFFFAVSFCRPLSLLVVAPNLHMFGWYRRWKMWWNDNISRNQNRRPNKIFWEENKELPKWWFSPFRIRLDLWYCNRAFATISHTSTFLWPSDCTIFECDTHGPLCTVHSEYTVCRLRAACTIHFGEFRCGCADMFVSMRVSHRIDTHTCTAYV